MTFDPIAKTLLNKAKAASGTLDASGVLGKANVLLELTDVGFSVKDVCAELRQLYDTSEEDNTRKQILDMIIKLHGLYGDDKKEAPKITFNVQCDPTKFNSMVCPPIPAELSEVLA